MQLIETSDFIMFRRMLKGSSKCLIQMRSSIMGRLEGLMDRRGVI